MAIERAGRAEAAETDLTVGALGIGTAVSGEADLVDAKFASATFCVGGAGETLVVLADLSTGAIVVADAVFAAIGGEVAFLVVCAIAVFAATGTASARVADLACSALCVGSTSDTFVELADLAVFAVLVNGAIFTGKVGRIADLVGTIAIVSASGAAFVVKADLASGALAIASATVYASSRAIANLGRILTIDIICAGDATELFADAAIGAIFVGETFATDACGSVADLAVCAVGVFAATITAAFGGGVTDLTARTIGICGAILAGIVFTHLTVGAVLVGGALFAGEFGGIADFSGGAVTILSATVAAFSSIADLTVVALAIGGAGFAFVVDADLSVGTLGAIATFALGACSLKTDESSGAVVVVEAACAGILSADLAILAVGVFEATFAGIGGEVAFLIVCAIGVFAATSAAFSAFADLARSALCVVGTSTAVVVDAHESASAIFVVAAVSAFTSAADTKRTLWAIAVIVATFADVFFADFPVFAVFVFFAVAIFASASGADFSGPTAGIITTSDTTVSIANLAVFAVFVFDAIAADIGSGIADTGGTMFIFEADHAGVGGGVADFSVFAIGICAATFDALAFFADTTCAAFGVVVARRASVVFADLAFGADAIRAVAIAFFAGSTDAHMTLIALLVGLAGKAASICTSGSVLTVCIVFAARALTYAIETGSALAFCVIFAATCADIVAAKADSTVFIFATISITDASVVASCGWTQHEGEPTTCDPHKKFTLFHDQPLLDRCLCFVKAR